MNVLVERYQRRKYVNQENAPMLYYIRQKSGNVRVMLFSNNTKIRNLRGEVK